MAFERYNKMWAALVPLLVFFINEYTDQTVTTEQVIDWGNAALMAMTPLLVWWVPNREPGQ